jgi:DNA-binding helix-hairpin-helix protein with protein kinase domain
LMPRIGNTIMLLQVFNPHLRAQLSTQIDGVFLYRTASNMSSAIGAIHEGNYIIGDLNECNILVTPKALVTVIDTDSFQAREEHDGRIIFYPCPVGRPEYTPPELQGKRLKGEVRQPEQDAFALSVLIFQLLFGGSHPFRSIWLGKDAPPPVEEKIFLGLFPFGNPSTTRGLVKPPPSISLNVLYPPLADLIMRSFVDGHDNPKKRPLAPEWENVLNAAELSLCTCTNHHIFAGHLAKCPHCGAKPIPVQKPRTHPVRAATYIPKPPARIPTIIHPAPARPATAVPAAAQQRPPTAVPAAAQQRPPTHIPAVQPQVIIPGNPGVPANRYCVNCNSAIPAVGLFCPKCASAIDPQTCKHCGHGQVPLGAKCCPMCGKPT